MPRILIALGSNVGKRAEQMQVAIDGLAPYLHWIKTSRVYETVPMYVEDQPCYLNAAAMGETDLGPFALLDLLKRMEQKVGRRKGSRYGPREIDLDLIAYGNLQLVSHRPHRSLVLPHPRTPERRFVLQPLADLDPNLVLPGLGRIEELLKATNDQAGDVKILNDAVLSVRR